MDKIKKIIADYEIIKSRLIKIAIGTLILKNITNIKDGDFESLEIMGDNVEISFENYRCGETEYQYATFPLSYLENDNWPELEKEKYRLLNEKKELEEKERKAKQKLDQEKYERALFLKLKNKFEPI